MGSSNFADAAIARALHYSMASSADSASSSSSLSAAPAPLLADITLPPAAYATTTTTCDSGRRQQNKQQQLAPAGGRAGKRRSRASKRAPTTYISTDPANFRIMVQHITGLVQADEDDHMMMLAAGNPPPPMMLSAGAYGNPLLPVVQPLAAGGDEASAPALQDHQFQQQQQPCFPTLDSWNVM